MSHELKIDAKIEEIAQNLSLESIGEIDPAILYTDDNLDYLVTMIQEQAEAEANDLTTDKGRKAIASRSHKVSRYKTALDDKGEELVADAKAKVKAVNDLRKTLCKNLDLVRDSVRRPLTDWETADATRIAAIETRMNQLFECGDVKANATVIEIEDLTRLASALYQFNWEEFTALADTNYNLVKNTLNGKLASRKQYDLDQAELKRFREEKAAREEKERQEREEQARQNIAIEIDASQGTPAQLAEQATAIATQAVSEAQKYWSEPMPVLEQFTNKPKPQPILFQDLVDIIREIKPLIPIDKLLKLPHRSQKILEAITKEPK